MKILHLDSSVTGAASVSRPLTKQVVEKLKSKSPDATVIYRDLIAEPLRHYTAVVRSVGADAVDLNADQKHELATGEAILAEFLAADTVVVGAPMYNFSIPSQLKAWIDLICVAGKTFSYTSEGPKGLCGGKKLVIVSSRGGLYGPGSPFEPFDHQEQYLKHVALFLGITDVSVVRAEGVAYGPEKAAEALTAAKQQIEAL